MKKLDIEKWERKAPKLPPHFFDEMQENVLKQTIRQPKKSAYTRLRNIWMAAAVLVLFFGLGGFLILNSNEKTLQEDQTISSAKHQSANQEMNRIEIDDELNEENTSLISPSQKNTISQNSIKLEQNSATQMEQVLSSMSKQELADLSSDYEQDIYLELY